MKAKRYGVCPSTVDEVSRRDNAIVLKLRELDGKRVSYTATVEFTGVSGVDSTDERNELAQPDLNDLGPNWAVDELSFSAGVASLGVHKPNMHHDVFPILHRIHCREVKVSKRPALARSAVRFLSRL